MATTEQLAETIGVSAACQALSVARSNLYRRRSVATGHPKPERSPSPRALYVDTLEATNNQAERMLRPAVITRKTNGCNRTPDGARTHAILSSVLVTCRQHSIPILDYLVQLQRFGGNPPPLVSALPLQTDLSSFPVSER